MLTWVLYNVMLPLSSVPLVYFGSFLAGAPRRLVAILRDGQLCFCCTSLSAATINDIFRARDFRPTSRSAIVLALLILCLILSTFTYGIAATRAVDAGWDDTWLGVTSIVTATTTTSLVLFARYSLGSF